MVMNLKSYPSRFNLFIVVCLTLFSTCTQALRAEISQANNSGLNETDARKVETALITNQDSQRSLLEIQEQLHNTQLAIEKSRRDTESTVASNSQLLEARLARMDAERLDALRDIQHSDKLILTAAGIFIFVGFLVLLTSAALQVVTIRRISAAAAQLGGQTVQHLSLGDGQLISSQALEQSNTRFLAMIERLEKRMGEMETGKQLTADTGAFSGTNGNGNGHSLLENGSASTSNTASQIRTLLGKGQTLLKLDKPDDALDCLDELLSIDPGNQEALIKKGAALERLQRLPEAIACYDKVISMDSSMTIAYLYKGAVFNRMERYSEALECYELALKSRQKKEQAANVIFETAD
jgi:tetratricopeptide (TPR) repeat protein